jgi:hypothetical protein
VRTLTTNPSKKFAWPPQSVIAPGPNFKWSRKVVFDFHEVIVKWVEQFTNFINLTYGYNIEPSSSRLYNLQFDPKLPITPEQFEQAFSAFARLSEGGYGDLQAHEGVVAAMRKIIAAGIGIEIWTWTPSASETQFSGLKSYGTGIAQRVTLDLIQKLNLPIDIVREVRFMSPDRKKWEMVEERIPLIVEDNPETAVGVGRGIGHAAILVPETYNDITSENVLRLTDRKHLAATVIGFFAKLDAAGVLL